MRRIRPALASLGLTLALVASASAQTLQQRLEHFEAVQERKTREARAAREARFARVQTRLAAPIERVALDGVPMRRAFGWWSRQSDVPLVIDWDRLERQGIDIDRPLKLKLEAVPAGQVLKLMMRQAAPATRLVHQVTPWYVEVLSKQSADRRSVLRVYDVRDLLMVIPHFDDAPSFDLRAALSNTDTGGGGESGTDDTGGGLFGDAEAQADDDRPATERERGRALLAMITDTIEPDIWRANGGESGTARYHRGLLLITAPPYVHRQIGTPVSRLTGRSVAR